MFDLIPVSVKLLFHQTDSMVLSVDTLLAISMSTNVCVLIYCACGQLQKCIRTNCCCKPNTCFANICQSYETKTQELSKSLTEQITVVILSLMAVACICYTHIIQVPFSIRLHSNEATLVQIILAINVGRYVYLICQDVFLYSEIDKQKFRTDMVHHVVTVVCYSVILVYMQNRLLGILGIITEINTIVIEMTKVMKTLGRHKTDIYKKMSVASCTVTIVFRAVIPVIFLIMGMFHETPFVMDYTALTVFFLCIIFFSVINVWLVLSTVQRVIKIFGNTGSTVNPETSRVGIQLHQLNSFRQNNLGYERPMGNINVNNVNYDDEKLNLNKKYIPKTNIKNVYLINDPEARNSEFENVVQIETNTHSQRNPLSDDENSLNLSVSDRNSQRSMSISSSSVLLSTIDDVATESSFHNSESNGMSNQQSNCVSSSLTENLPREMCSPHDDFGSL